MEILHTEPHHVLPKGPLRLIVVGGERHVPDFRRILEHMGHTVTTMPLRPRELYQRIDEEGADLVVTVNFSPEVCKVCRMHGIPYWARVVDVIVNSEPWSAEPYDRAYIFDFSRSQVARFKQIGFRNAFHLPLAADPGVYHPVALSEEDLARYECDISFAGSALLEVGNEYPILERIVRDEAARNPDPETRRKFGAIHEIYTRAIPIQGDLHDRFILPDMVREEWKHLELGPPICIAGQTEESTLLVVSKQAAALARWRLLRSLAPWRPHLYGYKDWTQVSVEGCIYRGYADHYTELPKVYNASRINLNLTRCYSKDALNSRIFEVLMCGGFLISNHRDEIGELFEIGKELICFRTTGELIEAARYYLGHPIERKDIAARGCRKAMDRHTYDGTIRAMLTTIREKEGATRTDATHLRTTTEPSGALPGRGEDMDAIQDIAFIRHLDCGIGSTYADYQFLYGFSLLLRPRTLLEVGTNRGVSTIVFATAMMSYFPKGRILSIDRDSEAQRVAARQIADRGLAGMISLVQGDSLSVLPQLFHDPKLHFDLTFLDGAHDFDTVMKEVEIAGPRSGYLLLHDTCQREGMRKVVQALRCGGKYDLIDIHYPSAEQWSLGQIHCTSRPGIAILRRRDLE